MSIGTCIRRLHIPPGHTGELLHCPDCNRGFWKIGETVPDGAISTLLQQCPRCKDYEGQPRMFVVILHSSMRVYMDAVRLESNSALLLENELG